MLTRTPHQHPNVSKPLKNHENKTTEHKQYNNLDYIDCVFVSLSQRFLNTAKYECLDVYIWILCVFLYCRTSFWQNSPVCNSAVITVAASAGLGPNGGEDGVDNGEGGEQAAFTVQGGKVAGENASWLS